MLSIVIPVYNSQDSLRVLFEGIRTALPGRPFEAIFIDDGSRDASWSVLEKLKSDYPEQVVAIRLSRNVGQHHAIACGLGFAKGDFVLTMDDDLQHPPSEIPKLIEKQESSGAEVVYGAYIDKRHPMWRNTGSWWLRRSSKAIAGNSGEGSSFRLMSKNIAAKMAEHLQTGFLFIDEIIHWYTSRIVSTPVEHHPRRFGKSGYTRGKLVGMYFDILVNYTAVPLKLMTWFGLLSSVITFLLGVRFIYNKLVHHVTVPGFTAQIVTILFSTSLLMFCMGIIGQYLYKLYQLQNRRPPFTIERVI